MCITGCKSCLEAHDVVSSLQALELDATQPWLDHSMLMPENGRSHIGRLQFVSRFPRGGESTLRLGASQLGATFIYHAVISAFTGSTVKDFQSALSL